MFNKFYASFKNFIKDNLFTFVVLLLFAIFMNYPLDYSIYTSGGTIDVNDRVVVSGEYKSSGSLNLAYVSELKATPFTYLLSYILPSWDRISLEEYQASDNETMDDIEKRARAYLELSKQSAIKVAYDYADKDFNISNTNYEIVYVDNSIKEDIKIGDILISVNNTKINDMNTYKNAVANSKIGDYIKLELKRNNKIIERKIKVQHINGEKLTGIMVLSLYEYDTSPKIEFKFKNNENGSSGGLMLSLAIYNKLTKEDITKCLKIVGTGTIDEDGSVGEIDGVKYKLMGAVKINADIFIAPSGDNYEECKKLIKEKKYNIKLIEAKTFKQVLDELEDINNA